MDAIVEGSILRAGERVRITAQLIHAQNDQHLRARSYEDDKRSASRRVDPASRTGSAASAWRRRLHNE